MPIPFRSGRLRGVVESVRAQGGTLLLSGWAVDPRRHRPVDAIYAYAHGVPLGAVRPDRYRQDVATKYGAGRAGFVVRVTTDRARAIASSSSLQVFAVGDGVASALPTLRTARSRSR